MSMRTSIEDCAEWLERQLAGPPPYIDILEREPELTAEEAYRIQFALMRRLAPKHGIVGYKAAYTSKVQQQAYGMTEPMIGTLLRSGLFPEEVPLRLIEGSRTVVEPEVAVVLERDVRGPGITALALPAAIAGYLPAIEIAVAPQKGRSKQMGIALHKVTGGIVVGQQITRPANLDLALEGVIAGINGEHVASGTGVEVLGNPLNAVAFIANKLAEFDMALPAGSIIMTGSVVAGFPVKSGDDVSIAFTHLGHLDVRFA